jgi:thiamine biosynthesis lipoprotein
MKLIKIVTSENFVFKIAFVFYLIFSGCKSRQALIYTTIEGFAQGTTYKIIFENSCGKGLVFSIDSILKDFDMSLSKYIRGSIISRINANDSSLTVDKHFKVVFSMSKQIWEQSEGLMDITVGPIIDYLGFGTSSRR